MPSRPKQVDKPERDPHVKALGFDVAAMTVAEFRETGIVLEPKMMHVQGDEQAWRSHSEHAGLTPRQDAISRGYARALAHAHWDRHGTLRGLRLHRTFPCLGFFRHVEWNGAVQMVQCDACGEELGVSYNEGEQDE